jgi:ABC-type transport system involved in cytochrome bd biosynthesis fused ATPase/permease subunit
MYKLTLQNDSQNLHLWVLFNEVIVVVVGLILFINFFGNFHWISAILTGLYIMFKVFLIRLVRRFIQVNDLQLTQFGSVGEFD